MTTYIIRRLLQAIVVLLVVTIFVFLAMRLLPGDPILMMVTNEQLSQYTPEQLEDLRHEYGLDKPLVVQYLDWMSNIIRGDLGTSMISKSPVAREITRRLPITLHLGVLAFVISIIVGVPAGMICAVRRGTFLDTLVTTLANIGITVPIFWLGILLIYLFSLKLRMLPVYGYTSPFIDFGLSTKQLLMPLFCLALFPIASIARITRSSMLDILRQDYIRTAWAKGLREQRVILRHALKNSLIPVVTLSGMAISGIFGGSVLIETVFNIPGMGRMAVTGIFSKDYPIVQAVTLMVSAVIILSNLIVDISYSWIDPRIRYG
jgi:peptide/nickel transport system permease protein